MEKTFKGQLLADYHQFVLEDYATLAQKQEIPDIIWRKEDLDAMVLPIPSSLYIMTARVAEVDVEVTVLDARPALNEAQWDQITETSLQITGDMLKICGVTDYYPDCPALTVTPHLYGVVVGFTGLDTISDDEIDGQDAYSVFLWPIESAIPTRIIKKWTDNRWLAFNN